VTFDPGVTQRTIRVEVVGDRIAERRERFSVVLLAPVGATVGDDSAVGTILDND